jgi:hypothetical protein
MPRTIAHLVGRQLTLHDSLAQPGNLVTMMATGKTGWLSGPVPDENGRSAVERFLNRSPSVVPVRGIGAQIVDATRPVGRQGEQVHDLDVTVAKELGRLPDPAESRAPEVVGGLARTQTSAPPVVANGTIFTTGDRSRCPRSTDSKPILWSHLRTAAHRASRGCEGPPRR